MNKYIELRGNRGVFLYLSSKKIKLQTSAAFGTLHLQHSGLLNIYFIPLTIQLCSTVIRKIIVHHIKVIIYVYQAGFILEN